MKNKKKIVFIITGFTKGGAEKQLFNLVSGIKNDFNIEVIGFFDGYYKEKLEKIGIKVHLIEIKSNLGIFKAIYFTNKIIKNIKPDIVQSMLAHANIVSKIINIINLKRYKLFTGVRNSQDSFLLGKLEKITSYFSELIITNSKTNKNALIKRGFKKDKIKVIYNGIQLKKAKEKYKYNKKIILTVAKFYNQKDYTTNVLVLEKLSKIRDDFKFLYVGTGPELEKIKKLIKDKELNKYIEFLGVRNDIPELMNSSNIFFLPTKFEGQANVLLEAMYYGCTIVTTDIPENKEICEAFFTKVGDIDNMSNIINNSLDKKIDFGEKRVNNTKLISNFSIEKMLNKYIEIYNNK